MNSLSDEQQKLAAENHNLIHAFIKLHHLDHDEYYGDMAEAYCSAIASFNKTKGSLSTFVYHAMYNRLKSIKRYQASTRRIPAEAIVSLDELRLEAEKTWSFYHCIPDLNVNVENTALHNIAIKKLMTECTSKELNLIFTAANKQISQRKAAKALGISQTTYCRRVKAAKEKALRIILEVLEPV